MKRKRTGSIFVIFTLAAVLAGFSLPGLTADYQEKQNLSQVDVYGSEAVQFPTSYHVLDCIKLLSYGYEEVELESGKIHTDEEIQEISREFLTYFTQKALIPKDSEIDSFKSNVFLAMKKEPEEEPVTESEENVVSEESVDSGENETYDGNTASDVYSYTDSYTVKAIRRNDRLDAVMNEMDIDNEPQSISAIVWQCLIQDQYGNELYLWIDDLSGKVISFQYILDVSLADYMGFNAEDIRYDYTYMEDFLKEYYEFSDVAVVYEDGGSSWYLFADKSDERALVDLTNHGQYVLMFNTH